jgi:hypothetical protein
LNVSYVLILKLALESRDDVVHVNMLTSILHYTGTS